jgi:hypothetical protein
LSSLWPKTPSAASVVAILTSVQQIRLSGFNNWKKTFANKNALLKHELSSCHRSSFIAWGSICGLQRAADRLQLTLSSQQSKM